MRSRSRTSVLTRKLLIITGRVAPMGDPRRAQRGEHGGGDRRQDPQGLRARASANGLRGQDTNALSIVLLSLVWPLAEHLTAHPDRRLAVALAIAGIAALAATGGRSGFVRALSRAGLVLLLGGVSTLILRQVAWRLHEIWLPVPAPLFHRWPTPPSFVSALAKGTFTVWTGERAETVRLTYEALGLYVVWYLILTTGVLFMVARGRRGLPSTVGTMLGSVASILVYAVLRLAILATLALEFGKPEVLWQHAYAVVSWLPLALILRCPGPPCGSPSFDDVPEHSEGAVPISSEVTGRRRRLGRLGRLAAGATSAAAGLCLAFAFTYNDPGFAKQGRVVIDEGHSDWEWTREPFDTTAFGIRAEYNYYCLSEYLSHFYKVTTINAQPTGLPTVDADATMAMPALADATRLTALLASPDSGARPWVASLDSADVLVIKTPTKPYSEAEIVGIVDFVERGGGLLLIGDHTNLFGMSTYLNSIASRFGMRFRHDDTFDLETTGFSTYERPRTWFHPAVRGVPTFEFLTSCTIEGAPGTEPVMVGCGLGSEEADYGHPNFFGNIAFDLRDRFGLFLQAAARRFGKGRVLLFTDSTCFSNFCMFSPGKPELAAGFVDYLNRRGEKHPHARLGSLVLSVMLICLAVAIDHRAGDRRRIACLAFCSCSAFVSGTAATSLLNAWMYGPIKEKTPAATIVFDTGHCDASFCDYVGVSALDRPQHFEELYMCAQRVGLHPRAGSFENLGGLSPAAVVIVNPVRGFSNNQVGKITRYVSAGGVLVVMSDAGMGESTANEILRPFGLEAHAVPVRARPVSAGSVEDAGVQGNTEDQGEGGHRAVAPVGADFYPALNLFGAPARGLGSPPVPNVFARDFGRGKVVVCLNSYRYCEAVVGRPLERTPPAADLAAIYREIFAILSPNESYELGP